MQARELKRLDKSLESFLSRLTAGLGRSERRHWAGVSVRGLLLDGERESIEPMARRLGESDQRPAAFRQPEPLVGGRAPGRVSQDDRHRARLLDHRRDELPQSRDLLGGRAAPVLRRTGQDDQLPAGGEPAPRRRGGGHQPTALLATLFTRELGRRSRSLPARGRAVRRRPPEQAGPRPGTARSGAGLAVTRGRRAGRRSLRGQLCVAFGPA